MPPPKPGDQKINVTIHPALVTIEVEMRLTPAELNKLQTECRLLLMDEGSNNPMSVISILLKKLSEDTQ